LKALKISLYLVAGLVVVVVAAVAIFAMTFDPNRYKGDIQRIVKERTGRTLELKGPLELAFWPSLGAKVSGVVLSEHGTAQPFVSLESLASDFDFASFGRAPAHFDPHEVELINARLLHMTDYSAVADRLPGGATEDDWQLLRPNLESLSDFAAWFAVLHSDIDPPELAHDERLLVRDAAAAASALEWSNETWRTLTSALKESTGRKGRELFHPLRLALTGRDSGPEMAGLLAAMGKDRALRRLHAAATR